MMKKFWKKQRRRLALMMACVLTVSGMTAARGIEAQAAKPQSVSWDVSESSYADKDTEIELIGEEQSVSVATGSNAATPSDAATSSDAAAKDAEASEDDGTGRITYQKEYTQLGAGTIVKLTAADSAVAVFTGTGLEDGFEGVIWDEIDENRYYYVLPEAGDYYFTVEAENLRISHIDVSYLDDQAVTQEEVRPEDIEWNLTAEGLGLTAGELTELSYAEENASDNIVISGVSGQNAVNIRTADTQIKAGSDITVTISAPATLTANGYDLGTVKGIVWDTTSPYNWQDFTVYFAEAGTYEIHAASGIYLKYLKLTYDVAEEEPVETPAEAVNTTWNFDGTGESYSGNLQSGEAEYNGIKISGKCVFRQANGDTQVNGTLRIPVSDEADSRLEITAHKSSGLVADEQTLTGESLDNYTVFAYEHKAESGVCYVDVVCSGAYIKTVKAVYEEEPEVPELTPVPELEMVDTAWSFVPADEHGYQEHLPVSAESWFDGIKIVTGTGKCDARVEAGDTQINGGAILYIPVAGAGKVTLEGYLDKSSLLIDNQAADAATGQWTNISYAYAGEAKYISVKVKSGSFYLKKISVAYDANQTDIIRVVAKDGSGDYTTIQAALDSIDKVPDEMNPARILIKPGIYEELVTVTKPYVLFQNLNESEEVRITYDRAVGHDSDPSKNFGTQYTATVTLDATAVGFQAKGITFENHYNLNQPNLGEDPSDRAQTPAVALVSQTDQIYFDSCRFIGRQDTLYLKGTARFYDADASINDRRVYFDNCYIEGTVDFIFGDANAYFNQCTLNMAYYKNGGYYTAANTTAKNTGFVFYDCELTVDPIYDETVNSSGIQKKKISLGRPWQTTNDYLAISSAVSFLDCTMSKHILKNGWNLWITSEKNASGTTIGRRSDTAVDKVRFSEYNTSLEDGETVDLSSRYLAGYAGKSEKLSVKNQKLVQAEIPEDELDNYTMDAVFTSVNTGEIWQPVLLIRETEIQEAEYYLAGMPTTAVVGEELNLGESTLHVINAAGVHSSFAVTSDMIVGYESSNVGFQTLYVVYDGHMLEFVVEVTPKAIDFVPSDDPEEEPEEPVEEPVEEPEEPIGKPEDPVEEPEKPEEPSEEPENPSQETGDRVSYDDDDDDTTSSMTMVTIAEVAVPLSGIENGSGWIADASGWRYQTASSGLAADTWVPVLSNGSVAWFYFGTDGYMKTGWVHHTDGRWYYLSEQADQTQGRMLVNTRTPDGYWVGSDGAWAEGM